MIDRTGVFQLLQYAKLARKWDFARSLAADWLAEWPGDQRMRRQLAELELREGLTQQAIEHLEEAIQVDPEDSQAYLPLIEAHRRVGNLARVTELEGCLALLGKRDPQARGRPPWVSMLLKAQRALKERDLEAAASYASLTLQEDPPTPLPAVLVVRLLLDASLEDRAVMLAREASEAWPRCIYLLMVMADYDLRVGNARRGVERLHRLAALDPSGEISARFMGPDHPYRNLWPSELTMRMLRPIPSQVAALAGMNRLPTPASAAPQAEGEPAHEPSAALSMGKTIPQDPAPTHQEQPQAQGEDSLEEVRQAFAQIAARLKAYQPSSQQDQKVPVYIALSSRTRLTQAFGYERFQRIHDALDALVDAVRRRPGWTAYRIYIDDPQCLKPFGIPPADPGNPWQIKLRLADLDKVLAQRGEMIAALLIAGGEQIIPFHELPNPTDDDDDMVPSDNPYATRDENYFVPEWPVGRLPVNDDVDLLVRMLRQAADYHQMERMRLSFFQRLRYWLASLLARLVKRGGQTFGYSASIWRKASLAVYRTIGSPRSLVTSPPTHAGALPSSLYTPAKLSYFNLHGIEDAPEWFGQRHPADEGTDDVDFPIALRPVDIINSGRAPHLVFTEACYGANILGKTPETALCLKFLASGSRAVIGSTKTSYGSVNPPLIAADLLGHHFWQSVNLGLPVGEALRRAKLNLAAEMHRRQGFLDGEDQKTLISFVLYGDPLYQAPLSPQIPPHKAVVRKAVRPVTIKISCALGQCNQSLEDLEPATVAKVKAIVEGYLPGMAGAEARLHRQRPACDQSDHQCPSQQLVSKGPVDHSTHTTVITFARKIPKGGHIHPSYAHLTIDSQGKILKLAVSR